jgi:hypothetical protein
MRSKGPYGRHHKPQERFDKRKVWPLLCTTRNGLLRSDGTARKRFAITHSSALADGVAPQA